MSFYNFERIFGLKCLNEQILTKSFVDFLARAMQHAALAISICNWRLNCPGPTTTTTTTSHLQINVLYSNPPVIMTAVRLSEQLLSFFINICKKKHFSGICSFFWKDVLFMKRPVGNNVWNFFYLLSSCQSTNSFRTLCIGDLDRLNLAIVV